MATKAGVGMSRHHNPNVADREAAEQAPQNAGVAKPDFVFMFASVGYDQYSLVRAVRESTGGVHLSGCSAEGTIAAEEADESNFSVVVTAISSDRLQWTNGIATGLRADSRAVGQQVAQNLQSDFSSAATGLFVFPDALAVNFDHFVSGLEGYLSPIASSHCGAERLGTTSPGGRLTNTTMMKSFPTALRTRCSRARFKLPGLSAMAVSRLVMSVK
jgi:hypothetical protein